MRIFYLLALTTALVVLSCKKEKTESAKPFVDVQKGTIVKTVQISVTSTSNNVNILGIVSSKNDAKPSFKTGGVISKLYIAEGDVVKKGQLIATLHMDEINAQVRQAEEALSKSQRDLNRAKNLYQDSVATLEQYQNATTAFEFASRTLEIAKFNRQYSETRAPISGKVVKLLARPGEVVGPGMPVCAILGTQNQDWVIKAGLVDRDWSKTKVGDKVDITIDAYPGKTFKGRVSQKSQVVANNSGTFDVEIKFDNQPVTLAAGLVAKISIKVAGTDSFATIPIEALVKSNGTIGEAFTIVDGKAKNVKLQIASVLGDKVAISSGLDGISELITTGALFLEDGDLVSKL
jgi:multidrug efflux system membrane fusion protein